MPSSVSDLISGGEESGLNRLFFIRFLPDRHPGVGYPPSTVYTVRFPTLYGHLEES